MRALATTGLWIAAAILLAVAGCSSNTATSADTSKPPAAPPAPATTSPAATSAATTSPVPDTEVSGPAVSPPPISPLSSPPPTVLGGWRIADQPFASGVLAPLDISNWAGVPSPPLPALTGQRLEDGVYAAEVATPWNSATPNRLDIKVIRIDKCITLANTSSCVSDGATPYAPTDLGIDRDNFYPMTVPLDATIGVGVVGYGCAGDIEEAGNGTDLAAMFSSFEKAYKASILPLYKAGKSEQDIMDAIRADPPAGFADAPATCGDSTTSYGLLYTASGDAPPLLLQGLTGFDEAADNHIPLTATSAVHLNTVQVTNGVMTLYWYASFFS